MATSPSTSTRGLSDHESEDVIPIEKVVILYASETGNSQDTAERIGREFKRYGKRCTVMSMELFDVVGYHYHNTWVFPLIATSFSCPTRHWSSLLLPRMVEAILRQRCSLCGQLFYDLPCPPTSWQVSAGLPGRSGADSFRCFLRALWPRRLIV